MMAHSVDKARFNMVQQQIRPWDVIDSRVLGLMESLPRDAFVPDAYRALAYADIEIPLAHGEHMMFPRVEARLMQALDLMPGDQVLEVGTGSAYLTACLAQLCQRVVSIDIHEDFTQAAGEKLQQVGITNVLLKSGDALAAPLEEGPFDVIAVTGSVGTSEQVEIFRQQLRIGGRLFVVVGTPPAMEAMLITRTSEKAFSEEGIFETDINNLTNAEPPRTFEF
ncbi:MAG: protein-L-isoaspartate O-methyltransferase [Candidatus Thiodiazotropha sp.]|jgi:protein-L-isoaspartate(D-aspartate) O-methyltransferase